MQISAACEWTLALSFLAFLWTLTPTMSDVYLQLAVFSSTSLQRLTAAPTSQPLLQGSQRRGASLNATPPRQRTRPATGTNGRRLTNSSQPTAYGTVSAGSAIMADGRSAPPMTASSIHGPIFGRMRGETLAQSSATDPQTLATPLPKGVDLHDREHFEALMDARRQSNPHRGNNPTTQAEV